MQEIIKNVEKVAQGICDKCECAYNSGVCIYNNEINGANCIAWELHKIVEKGKNELLL